MVRLIRLLSKSPQETRELGRKLGLSVAPGDVLALRGDLGSGKSVLARGILESLGVKGIMPSPSFVIVASYDAPVPVNHIDLYRLETAGEALDLGLEELLYSDGICIIEWAERHPFKSESIFCINVAKDTLRDTKFIAFIKEKLQKNKIPAASLCFEIEETDAHENTEDSIVFTEAIRKLGCLVTLCSFGQSSASMELLKKMKFDYLKIDGSIVCNMLYDDEDMIRIKGINQIARRLSIKTIAELVETKETITKLQEIGINYAQGFGIAKPRPLDELHSVVKSSTPTPKITEGEKIRESA